MELILSQPGFNFCEEPLNIRRSLVQKNLGIKEWQLLYSDEAEEKLYKYFQALSNGKFHFTNLRPFKKYYRPITHRIAFKVIHGCEDRINWIRDNFNGRIVFLMRHPIPVSLSRQELPRLEAFSNSDYSRRFSPEQLQIAKEIILSGSKIEKGILSWCFQNAIPLRDADDDWSIITYEQMVIDPIPAIHYLAEKLELPKPERMIKRLHIPSAVVNQSDNKTRETLKDKNVDNRYYLVNKWKKTVSDSEEKSCMEILNHFNLDIYRSGDVLPADRFWIKAISQSN